LEGEIFWCYAEDWKVEEGGADAVKETLSDEEVPYLKNG
jgi:hypothetical protein